MKKYVWVLGFGALAIFLLFIGVVSVQMLSPRDGKQVVHFITKTRGSDAWGYLSTINPPKQWTTYYAHTQYSEWVKDQIKAGLPSKLASLPQSERLSVIEDISRTPAMLLAFDKMATQKIHYRILSEDCRKEKHQQHLAFGDADYSHLYRKAKYTCLRVTAYKMEKPTIKGFQNEVIRGYALKYIAQIEDGQKPHIPNYAVWTATRDKLLAEKRAAENKRLLDLYISGIYSDVFGRLTEESLTFSRTDDVTIQIRLGKYGQLLGTPIILKSNGDAHFNHSVIDAVEASAPFSPPSGVPYSVFGKPIKIEFQT